MSRHDRTPEQHRPYVDLLDRVAVVKAEDRVAYNRVRLRLDEVRSWFITNPGWHMIESDGVARLVKTPARAAVGQGVPGLDTPLDYELATWVLWYGERTEAEQFVLSQLIEEVEIQANADTAPEAEPHLDWNRRPDREALDRAMRALERMGAIRTVHGDTAEWARTGAGDTLYEFTGVAQHLYVLLPEALYDALVLDGDRSALDRAWGPEPTPRERLFRTLLLTTALHAADDPEAFAYLSRRERREQVVDEIRRAFGWDVEITQSYAALLRPFTDQLGQRAFPPRTSEAHAILLLSAHLRSEVETGALEPEPDESLRMTLAAFETALLRVKEEQGANWPKKIRVMGIQTLAATVLSEMRAWDLASGPDEDGYVTVKPLGVRYVGRYAEHGEGYSTEDDE